MFMNMRSYRMVFAGILIFILGILLIYSLWPYVNAFFGAMILYVLFKPLYSIFIEKFKLNKTLSALLVILITFVLVIVPISFIAVIVSGEAIDFFQNKESFTGFVNSVDAFFPSLNLKAMLVSQFSNIGDFVTHLFLDLLKGLGSLFVILIIMYFTLFYLFIYDVAILEGLVPFIPFNEKNTNRLIKEFKNITHSTVVSSGIIAIVQGFLVTVAFLLFGVQGALLWGFVSVFLSFLPVIGPPIVWIPALLIKFFNQSYVAAIGLLIFGIIISVSDNLARPYLQKRVGNIHPLTSLVGIFIGVPIIGLLGIIIGPILISYVVLTIKMFKEEYVE